MTPSQYISSMSLTTEEKYAAIRKTKPAQIIEYFDMKKTTYQTETQVKVDEAVFQAFPSEIVFQNFSAKRTYQVPIQLRNNDKVPRSIQISRENGPFFSVTVPEESNSKIAPGMSFTIFVNFSPEVVKDYDHDLVCVSERERTVIPIKCIGARGFLDFPDFVSLDECPVKMTKEKTLLVRNIGKDTVKFSMKTADNAFVVSPSYGELKEKL